ncbi:hypothetical protein BD413DRAFT_546944 [Trametes elegans]|nr:hypothetical protein BD413DRAFT_546944 [Trametes elegans]
MRASRHVARGYMRHRVTTAYFPASVRQALPYLFKAMDDPNNLDAAVQMAFPDAHPRHECRIS